MYFGTAHFLGQHPQEKIILLLRRHFLVLLGSLIPAFFLAGAIFLGYRFIPRYISILAEEPYHDFFLLGMNVFSLYVIGFAFLLWMDWYLDAWILTNERIIDIKQTGLFGRDVSEFKLDRIQDVTVHAKGVFPTIFNYGDVRIQTAGEKVDFIFEQVPSPYKVKDTILKVAHQSNPV